MGADLHIHVAYKGIEEDLKCFLASSIGSKYYNNSNGCKKSCNCEHWDRVLKSKSVWIGEVSWLKAALFSDPKTFIPDTVGKISDLIGDELPVLTRELKDKILEAFKAPNKTGYSLANPSKVNIFLKKHMGKRLFTVSW